MSQEIFGTGRYRGRRERRGTPSRLYVGAFVVAAVAVCLGGASAIAAVSHGAPAGASLLLMAALVTGGLMAAVAVVVLGRRRRNRIPRGTSGRRTRRGRRADRRVARRDRREMRRDRRALGRAKTCSPAVMLEEQLSARYAVPVERVAGHVWRIDGELVEATLDPVTGQLMTGGRELRP